MYELTRVRLESVGPEGARYEDVLLDFQDRDGDPARGAIIHLENGGGKSALLKLLFATLLPGRRNVLGKSTRKTLENFVLSGDTAHVALEWREVNAHGDPLSGRLITGKVYEWRNRQRSADAGNLREAWYTLRPVEDTVTLDTLPTKAESDGRTYRRLFASYKEQLEEAHRTCPALDLVWTDVQRQWLEHLDAIGLDPELFRYQGKMNVDEGDADELFAFDTQEAFVNFLLGAVTDMAGPNELAANVDAYADKLRDRESLQLEATFIDGALERLRPLAAAATERDAAAAALATARIAAVMLHSRFAVAASKATVEAERLASRGEEQEASASRLGTRSRELQAQMQELRRLAAQFRLDDAEAALETAQVVRGEATELLDAWRATEPLAAHREAAAKVTALGAELAVAEQAAAPLLERRAAAARGYAGTLMALIDEARAASLSADADAAAANTEASTAESEAGTELARAGRLRAEGRAAQKSLDEIAAERERLIADKSLNRGQTAVEALEALALRQADAERRERQAAERIAAIHARVQQLSEEAADTSIERSRASDEAQRIDGEHQALSGRAHKLADTERLSELLAVDHVDIWKMAEPLHRGLVEAAGRSEREIVLLELEAADDRHARAALEQTGRLPAARDADDAVAALRAANVPAVTGWDFLANSIPAQQREPLLRRLPELIGGVVVTNPAYRERAESALATAGLKPTTVVVVGDSEELTAPAASTRERFIVAPNVALYDETAGAGERAVREERLAQVDERRAALHDLYRVDQDLRYQLETVLSDCPAGHLESLAQAADEQRGLVAAAAAAIEAAEAQRAALTAERGERAEAVSAAQSELRTVAGIRPQLESFERRCMTESELRSTARRCDQEATQANESSASHSVAAQTHRERAQELTRTAVEHHGYANRLGEQLRSVEGAGEEISREKVGEIEELQSAYELATRLLREATTESELAAEHRRAQAAEAEALSRLEQHDTAVLPRAADLLSQATDRASRADGERRAARRAKAAEEERANRLAERNQRQDELNREIPRDESGRGPRAQLTPELTPADLEHATRLQRQLDAQLAKSQEDQRAAADAARQAREGATKAEAHAKVIGSYLEGIATVISSDGEPLGSGQPQTGVVAFDGNQNEARELMRETVETVQGADRKHDTAKDMVRRLADQLSRFAQDDEFESMSGGRLRQSLTREDSDTLAGRASELVPHLETRVAEVRKEIESIEQHRGALVQRLASLVQEGCGYLRVAGRASRLPANLDDWSGKPFLQIDFKTPDSEDVLLERLGEVLDETVTQASNREGLSLLLRGVRAAAEPTGFNVTVLKPESVLKDVRVPITDMPVFSGGQRLTAAIALYCTLASMRSSSRGRQRPRAGVLFLDNPIGKASAEYLLDVQLKVADRTGVQLIYTTGLSDLTALSMFPCIVRLRNDQELVSGLQHIHVADHIRHGLLNDHRTDDGRAHIDVARVVVDETDEPAAV